MQLISVKLPEGQLEQIHTLVRQRVYPSRSELIRVAVQTLLDQEL